MFWATGNIAGENTKSRDRVLDSEYLSVIKQILEKSLSLKKAGSEESPTPSFMRNLAWSLSNVARGKPEVSFDFVIP